MRNLSSGLYPKTNRNLSAKPAEFEDYEILDIDFEEMSVTTFEEKLSRTLAACIGWTIVGIGKTFEICLPLLTKASVFVFVLFCKSVHLSLSYVWQEWTKAGGQSKVSNPGPNVRIENNVFVDSDSNVHIENNVFFD